jgi:hypothetical protein
MQVCEEALKVLRVSNFFYLYLSVGIYVKGIFILFNIGKTYKKVEIVHNPAVQSVVPKLY